MLSRSSEGILDDGSSLLFRAPGNLSLGTQECRPPTLPYSNPVGIRLGLSFALSELRGPTLAFDRRWRCQAPSQSSREPSVRVGKYMKGPEMGGGWTCAPDLP